MTMIINKKLYTINLLQTDIAEWYLTTNICNKIRPSKYPLFFKEDKKPKESIDCVYRIKEYNEFSYLWRFNNHKDKWLHSEFKK